MHTKLQPKDIKYFRRKVIEWGILNYKNFPWRSNKNRYHGLVAEIMLQRTKAEQVEPIYSRFMKQYQTPLDFLENPDESLFKNLGLPERNKQFLKLNKILSNIQIPQEKDILLSLPGIGEYISSAFLSLHLDKRAYLIDSNIIRIYGRYVGFEFNAETRRKKWFINLVDEMTPKRKHKVYNYSLIDLSRDICKSKPLCQKCPVQKKCAHYSSNCMIECDSN